MSLNCLPFAVSSHKWDWFGSDSLLSLIEMKHFWHFFLCLKGKDVLLLCWAHGRDQEGSRQQVEWQVAHGPQVRALFMPPTQGGIKSRVAESSMGSAGQMRGQETKGKVISHHAWPTSVGTSEAKVVLCRGSALHRFTGIFLPQLFLLSSWAVYYSR